jgi:hypothetical protein
MTLWEIRDVKKSAPLIPVSWGELIDKITILEIKRVRLEGDAVLANVGRELAALKAIAAPVLGDDKAASHLMTRLKALNQTLWDLEIGVRARESANRLDAEFVELARAIYRHNDERAALKRQLNLQLGSELIEEKNYKPSN